MRIGTSCFLVAVVAVAALMPACSCGGDDTSTGSSATSGSGGGGGGQLDSVTVEPAAVTLEVQLGGTAAQTYQAFADIDGQRTDVSGSCSWTVDAAFGIMNGPELAAAPHGGTTQVVASCGGATGQSELTIDLTGELVVGAGTPPNAPDLFDAAQPGNDPARTPKMVYPLDGAIAPLNIPSIDAQWLSAQNDLFHLSMTSAHLAVDLYTTDISGMLSDLHWEEVAGTAAGGDLAIAVEGLNQADPGTKFAGAPVVLRLSTDTIDKTALYYWASSQGSIMTQVFGSTSAPTALISDCTSCHSVSRSGRRIGYSRCVGNDCGQIFAGFMRFDAATNTWVDTVDANNKAISGSYTTFSPVGNPYPDDTQALAILTMSTARLDLFDPDTGVQIPSNLSDVTTHGPGAPRSALMPDWSPDGTQVVFASTPNPGQWIDLSDSAIAMSTYAYDGVTHAFGEPTFLVSAPITLPSGVYNNFFFPSFSPDGQYIVFNAARAAWRNFSVAGSPGQRLLLTDVTGAWAVELAAMNGEGDLDITWPHWAPGANNDYLWIVFSSERDYGHKVTAQNSAPACVANGVQQCKQLWIGAVDRQKLMAGGAPADPSAPPVWLPGQDIGADNISPYWTVPAVDTPE